MKKLLTFFCVLGTLPLCSSAQQRILPASDASFERKTLEILNKQLQRHGMKPAAGDPICLTSYALYVEGALRDSIRYVYSGGRGTGMQPADVTYDHGFYWPQAPVTPSELSNTSHDYMPYDSMFCFFADSAGLLSEYKRYMKSYNSDNLLTQLLTQDFTAAFNSYKYEVLYDEAGRLLQVLSGLDFSEDLSGDYHPHINMYFGYDVTGLRTLDSVIAPGLLDARYNNYYYYNPAGLPDSMIQVHASGAGFSYYNHMRFNYSYDSLQRLIKAQRELWLADTGWVTMTEQHLSYTGNAKLPTYRLVLDAGNWDEPLLPYALYEATLLPGGLQYDTVFVKLDVSGGGVLENYALWKNHYTADDVLSAQYVYYWSSEGSTLLGGSAAGYSHSPGELHQYTYTGLTPAAVPESPLFSTGCVYPNPAKDYLMVEVAGLASVVVYNLAGKLLLQQNGDAHMGRMKLNIASLPAGRYMAEVKSAQGRQQLNFVKE